MSQLQLDVSYGQVAVFDPDLENPFNDWSERHNLQGFSWRPGSVSFATLENAGPIRILVTRSVEYSQGRNITRAIRVPFLVTSSGKVEIASIASSLVVEIPEGEYSLFFEHTILANEGIMAANLRFVPHATHPKVLIMDDLLSPEYPLLMEADPA